MNKKRFSYVLLVSLFASILSLSSAEAADQAGGKCKKAGQKVRINGTELICSLVWVTSPTSSKPSTSASKQMQSKSFRLETVTFEEGVLGAQATARVTNISSNVKSAFFTITIFGTDGKTVAQSLNAVANSVPAGQTITLNFLGTKDLPSGTFKYSFQVDTELNG